MRKNIFLLMFFLGGLSLRGIMLPPKKTFSELPPGNYLKSCRNIQLTIQGEGVNKKRIITAECQDLAGNWKQTTITRPAEDYAYADRALRNVDGTLEVKTIEAPYYASREVQDNLLKENARQVLNEVKELKEQK